MITDRHSFPGLNDEEFINFNNGAKYFDNVIKFITLNDEEKLLQETLTVRVSNEFKSDELLYDSMFHLLSLPVYKLALKRITGYDLHTIWNGTFPFDQYPTLIKE